MYLFDLFLLLLMHLLTDLPIYVLLLIPGVSGDWKNKLTPEQEEKINQWIHKNLDSFGINFKYGV